MSSLANIYTDAIKNNLKPLFGNWEPTKPIRLGDYGYLDKGLFLPIGNIVKDYGLKFKSIKTKGDSNKSFYSQDGVSIAVSPEVMPDADKTLPLKAKLEISFAKENCIYFNAEGCGYENIGDIFTLGTEILKLHEIGKWNKDYVVVTDRIQASVCLIVISGSNKAFISFESKIEHKPNIASIGGNLNIVKQQDIGYLVNSSSNIVPLMALAKLQSKFPLWSGSEFRQHYVSPDSESNSNSNLDINELSSCLEFQKID